MSAGRSVPTRLNRRHIERHALKAIAARLLEPHPEALLAVERVPGAVIVRVNSGGNELAVESWLNFRGYHAEYAGSNPDGYGCALRVTTRTAAVTS